MTVITLSSVVLIVYAADRWVLALGEATGLENQLSDDQVERLTFPVHC
jgi:hypothetical protein